MQKFSILGVPVGVEWWFWLTTAILGPGSTSRNPDLARLGAWIAVVFVSILVHELGHAFAGRHFGATPFIRLHGFGGVTFLPGASFTRVQNILISAAGPAAGLFLGVIILAVSRVFLDLPPLADRAISYGLYVNFFWTFVNLLPIHPLDGGQILAQVLGPRRRQITSWIGFTLASVLCLWALKVDQPFMALMLAMFAYYNLKHELVSGGVVTERTVPPTDRFSR
jgi:stage IV sporulation protein FB